MESKRHMVGVVVSWDPELRAPQKWIDRVYSVSEVSSRFLYASYIHFLITRGCNAPVVSISMTTQGLNAENTPHYKVLFGGHDPSSVIIGYLPQTQLERITGMKVRIKEILTHHQTCLTHHGLTDGCCSRTFPLWRITSHIMTGSGLSCSPGSASCFPRTWLRTKSCSPGSRSFRKGVFFYCTSAGMSGIKLHSILISSFEKTENLGFLRKCVND